MNWVNHLACSFSHHIRVLSFYNVYISLNGQKKIVSTNNFMLVTSTFIVRNVLCPRELSHTIILYQVRPYLQINAIKPSCHHDWGRMMVVSKVILFLNSFCTESKGKYLNFGIKIKIKEHLP